jgi:hypothetical protein
MLYYTVMQSQFAKGKVSTEVVRVVDSYTKYGVRGWLNNNYLGIDWFNSEKEARNEARRLAQLG